MILCVSVCSLGVGEDCLSWCFRLVVRVFKRWFFAFLGAVCSLLVVRWNWCGWVGFKITLVSKTARPELLLAS